jgi:hypothetical protein
MHPQKHAKLMEDLQITVLVASAILPIALCIYSIIPSISIIMFILWILIVLITIISWSITVRCTNPYCIGRMTRVNTPIAEFKVKLSYKCQICTHRYITIIFQIPHIFPLSDT